MMKNVWIAIAVFAGVVLLIGLSAVSRYNDLVAAREEVDGAWAQVENVLQRRADLVPNLVATVKGFAAQEKSILTDIADARSRLLGAKGPAAAAEANEGLESALGRLLAIAESYPELRSNQNFIRLQDELAGTENRIAVARMRYNETVRDYNAMIRRFPTNLVAAPLGFTQREYFEAEAPAQEVPEVEFDRGAQLPMPHVPAPR